MKTKESYQKIHLDQKSQEHILQNILDSQEKQVQKHYSLMFVSVLLVLFLIPSALSFFISSDSSHKDNPKYFGGLESSQVVYVVQQFHDSSFKLNGDFQNEDDLMKKSDYIIQGTVTHKSEPIDYNGISFEEITFEVSETLYASQDIGNTLTIIREKELFQSLETNHQYILFLSDYTDTVLGDTKMVNGGNLGVYEILPASQCDSIRTLDQFKNTIQTYILNR